MKEELNVETTDSKIEDIIYTLSDMKTKQIIKVLVAAMHIKKASKKMEELGC